MTTSSQSVSGERLYGRTIDSPVGELQLIASDHGLRAVLWGTEADRVKVGEVLDGAGNAVLEECARQLAEYFAGRRLEFELPLDPTGTEFQQAAWAVLRTIPFGETMTYGTQARRLGDPNRARAVGAANGKNPISIIVPCHRVIGANGHLTGFAGGLSTKEWLLDHEARVRAVS